MLLLASTSDKIQVITTIAGTIHVHVSYMDVEVATKDVTPDRDNTIITTAATIDVVPAPASGFVRNVKTLHVGNPHATLANTVTIQHTDGTNVIEIEKVTLLPGERLAYREGIGTRVIDANGIEKTNPAAAVLTKLLASDQSNSTTTLTNVAGIEMSCPVGTWIFEYFLRYQAAATTTGVRFSVNHDGVVSAFMAWRLFPDATATASTAVPDQDQVLATAAVMDVFAARAKSTTGWGTTLSVDAANADMLEVVQGLVTVTTDGNLELWHGSEVAAASTIKAGSALRLTRVG